MLVSIKFRIDDGCLYRLVLDFDYLCCVVDFARAVSKTTVILDAQSGVNHRPRVPLRG